MAFKFPVTIIKKDGPSFKLEDRAERAKYFQFKVSQEIEKIRKYISGGGIFMGIMLGPKNSGKGTYTKMLMEATGIDSIVHISVGDIVRKVSSELADPEKKTQLVDFLKKRYRGFISIEKALDVISGRDTKTLLPDEIILALVEREIDALGRKPVFIDGFPRNLDQIKTALYFRTLMGYRNDPDFLVFIDIPDTLIDERIKQRVICPICQTPRSLKLLRTKEVGYDADKKSFYLKCDTPTCNGARMVGKEGDELGIEAIRDRIEVDKKVMTQLLELQGVPHVYLRNYLPVEGADSAANDYEITPGYRYELNGSEVKMIEEPFSLPDDDGVMSYSLLPAGVVVSFIKQLASLIEKF